VPLDIEIPAAQAPLEIVLPMTGLNQVNLFGPLKGRMGLRDECGQAHGHMAAAVRFRQRPIGQLRDAFDVFVRFSGQPDHEIELERFPAGGEDLSRRSQQIRLRVAFVDRIPQPLRARLRGQCEACLADPLDLFHQGPGQGFRTQGRQGQRNATVVVAVHQGGEQGFDAAVIAGAQRQQ
jgi:hypothetical protein